MSWKFHTRELQAAPRVRGVLLLALMAVFIESGCAIQCFVCDSSVNPGCTNLKSNSSIVAETCTLEKMRTINTWLFELNAIAYFNSNIKNVPPMNCQKVVAKQSADSEPITARFCQLDTRDTNACTFFKDKLLPPGSRRSGDEDNLIHCSICSTDRCNGSERLHMTSALGYLFVACLLRVLG